MALFPVDRLDACDCHVHVFDPARFPYTAARAYTPPAATVADLRAFHAGLGIARTVLVQPSCYGTDNRALCAALATLGSDSARGVAVVDARTVADEELDRLHRLGVRGLRLNFHVQGEGDAERACIAAAERIRAWGWHLQVYVDSATLDALAPVLERLPVAVALDHFGGGAASAETLSRLLASGHVWVKLSAPYRVSQAYDELVPLVARLAAERPDRLVWASDWPHTGGHGGLARRPEALEPFRTVDVAADLRALLAALGDDRRWRAVLADNPARLYGF